MAGFRAFFLFRDSRQRRDALGAELGSAERYCLFGLDQLVERGVAVRHNLEPGLEPSPIVRRAGMLASRVVDAAGGHGGDFASVIASRRAAAAADVVFSTVDTVGLPLIALRRAGFLRRPVVYASIGLPERLARLRGERVRRLYADGLRSVDTLVTYSEHEADELRRWIGVRGRPPRIAFVPFGVDTTFFRPDPGRLPDVDVVSIGADPRRDLSLLIRAASLMPERSFRIVTTVDRARSLGPLPGNVTLESEISFREMRERLAAARVVALPVKDNSYSGATTVLLQAMAMAKPVVVSRTEAIARGYGLVDGESCRLVEPGDLDALERAIRELLRNEAGSASLGARARETVERSLSWPRYADAVYDALAGAARRHSRR